MVLLLVSKGFRVLDPFHLFCGQRPSDFFGFRESARWMWGMQWKDCSTEKNRIGLYKHLSAETHNADSVQTSLPKRALLLIRCHFAPCTNSSSQLARKPVELGCTQRDRTPCQSRMFSKVRPRKQCIISLLLSLTKMSFLSAVKFIILYMSKQRLISAQVSLFWISVNTEDCKSSRKHFLCALPAPPPKYMYTCVCLQDIWW